MKSALYNLLQQTGDLTLETILINLSMAAVMGLVIFVSYLYTHAGTVYSRKFNVSLVMLTVLTATVMTVIGNNLALSLGMVGALSIVRFRTAIKDSRDTAYIFWTIIVGICCGAGDYLVAAIGSAVVFVLLLLLGRVRNDDRMLLIIRAARSAEAEIQSVVYLYYTAFAHLKVKNTTQETVELIYELPRRALRNAQSKEESITDRLYKIGRVEYVNLVSQSDEVSG
ncbi:MAG: DUF4956 domain-containing protein [Angelakisella sp.]|nr:DUF4956 domain-containing protein [Angelakisella sp.]